jgi:hypothetical protein
MVALIRGLQSKFEKLAHSFSTSRPEKAVGDADVETVVDSPLSHILL